MKKTAKIIGIVLGSVLALAFLAVIGFHTYDRIKYSDFYSRSEIEFSIPGVWDNFVPQGFDYHKEEDVFLSCGYMSDNTSSRIYVIDREGESHYTELQGEAGELYIGHAGGLAYYKDLVYVADMEGVDVFRLSDILDPNVKSTKSLGRIDMLGLVPAFCYVVDTGEAGGRLLVGSFHDEESYPTDEKFHVTTPSGEVNKGTILVFDFDEEKPFGVDATAPTMVFSLPSRVQGMTITDDNKIVLSTSFGLSTSKLYVHDMDKIAETAEMGYGEETFGVDIPLGHFCADTLVETIDAPPMSEELVYLDGKIWVMNESACNKYIFGKLTSGNNLRSFAYPAEEE